MAVAGDLRAQRLDGLTLGGDRGRDLGIFYVIQHTIGRHMYNEDRLLNYREFCQLLGKREDRMWFSQLLVFYLDLGKRDTRAWRRLDEALDAIWDLGNFIDRVVKGGRSIETRLISEGRLKPLSPAARRLRILTANRYPKSQNPGLNRAAPLRGAAGLASQRDRTIDHDT